MHSECLHLGEIFRQRREERNLSLREIENATSIRIGYLQAIEEGEFGKLISPVYAQGFMRKYANFLEMDADLLFKEHPLILDALNEPHSNSQEAFSLGLGTIEVRGTPGGEVKWLPNLLWVGISVVTILTGWFLARYLGVF